MLFFRLGYIVSPSYRISWRLLATYIKKCYMQHACFRLSSTTSSLWTIATISIVLSLVAISQDSAHPIARYLLHHCCTIIVGHLWSLKILTGHHLSRNNVKNGSADTEIWVGDGLDRGVRDEIGGRAKRVGRYVWRYRWSEWQRL